MELLANSDNVVRAGLTPKHIDVPELLKLTDPAVGVPVIEPRPLGGGVYVYDSPAPEFRLYRAELGLARGHAAWQRRARIVLCIDGAGDAARENGRAQGRPGANRATCPRPTER